jgi:hypothetical protein
MCLSTGGCPASRACCDVSLMGLKETPKRGLACIVAPSVLFLVSVVVSLDDGLTFLFSLASCFYSDLFIQSDC